MFTKCFNITKKRAVLLLILLAAVMSAAVILCSGSSAGFGLTEIINVSSAEGRERYISSLGWDADMESEKAQEIILPRCFDGVMKEYAKMQLDQGYSFADCAGLDCTLYTYTLRNYPEHDGTVYLCLYVRGSRVIGGDVHSAELNGFMHGLR